MALMKQVSVNQESLFVSAEWKHAPQVEDNTHQIWPLKNIAKPSENDVLFGIPGHRQKRHQGNSKFRMLMETVLSSVFGKQMKGCPTKKGLTASATQVVKEWRCQSPPGRFLQLDDKTGLWNDIGEKLARKKTRRRMKAIVDETCDDTTSTCTSSEDNLGLCSGNGESSEAHNDHYGSPRHVRQPSDPINQNLLGLGTSVSIAVKLPHSYLTISLNDSPDPELPKVLLSACVADNDNGSGNTFLDCSGITTVYVPDSHIPMEASVLHGCCSSVSVGLPVLENITSLACQGGSSLKITELDDPDTSLYEYAFIGYSPEMQITVVATLWWTTSPGSDKHPVMQGKIFTPSLK